ncbi:hypothetical protein Taro_016098 [Colocasia esculenta]|uniref:GH16 domain-containing protein n=1 Tax=Colocasia esculenta TaxID=4460 RepID=A0A843UJQ1_COLES|nr:hypothetical protein [Colocasia esculenta]
MRRNSTALDPDAVETRPPQLPRSTPRFISPAHPLRPPQLALTTVFLLLFRCDPSLQLQQRQHLLLLQPYPSDPMAAADPSADSCYRSLHHTRVLNEIAVDYTPDACHHSPDTGEIRVTYDHRGGARWRSRHRFRHGSFGARIRCPGGDTSGLNFNLYLSSLEGDKSQDEIDFEFLGKDRTVIQTNYYVGGAGGRELVHPLGFDAAEGFHEYLIRWEEGFIEWVVDGKVVRREERVPGEGWPDKPMYLYASVWDASEIDEGRWTGKYVGTHAPYVCWYRDVRVPVQIMAVDAEEEEEVEASE